MSSNPKLSYRQIMAEVGLDLSGHSTKGLQQHLGQVHFAYLVGQEISGGTVEALLPGGSIKDE